MPAVMNRTSCRIRVPRKVLLKALAEIKRVAPSRSAKPILQCVRLEGRKGRLHLAATDLEMTLSLTLEALPSYVRLNPPTPAVRAERAFSAS